MQTSLDPLERGYTVLLKNRRLGIESQSMPSSRLAIARRNPEGESAELPLLEAINI
jgi:hypothetical protein